ncbi:SCO2522 family protein [Actinoplanes sp. NPDC024001]|uniref:SCO2522 family protein n=1 Tax=Actinoplanes sp. NPDC024001 TaxID=3154598 RepID=UPI0033FA3B6F
MTVPSHSRRIVYRETAADRAPQSVGLSHVSIELGHLYMEDLQVPESESRLAEYFRSVSYWVKSVESMGRWGTTSPRISTCFLIDDYFSRLDEPRVIIKKVVDAASKSGLAIDYIARESSCAEFGTAQLARQVFDRIVPEPLPGANGSRPPVKESGWLANGRRSFDPSLEPAMADQSWHSPEQSAANRHSIFMDVQIRDSLWSCSFLAAVWQLLRLGLLRPEEKQLTKPVPLRDEFPSDWSELPPVIKLTATKNPFCAYRSFSILPTRFMEVEMAARTVLHQVELDPLVLEDLNGRASLEGIQLPPGILDRIDYAFINDWSPTTGR